MVLTDFTRDLPHSLAYGPGALFCVSLGSHSPLGLCCCCFQTDVCLLLFLTSWIGIGLATLNMTEGCWAAGTTCYCQQPCPACCAQVSQGRAFLGEGSALLLFGSLWLLAHPPHGPVPLLEALKDPEDMDMSPPQLTELLLVTQYITVTEHQQKVLCIPVY